MICFLKNMSFTHSVMEWNALTPPPPPPNPHQKNFKKQKKIHSKTRYLISLSLSCYWINNANANDTPSACKENLYKARL